MKEMVHPGEILKEEMNERGLSAPEIAVAADMDVVYITALLNRKADITPIAAKKLGKAFGVSSVFFLNLQDQYNAAASGQAQRVV